MTIFIWMISFDFYLPHYEIWYLSSHYLAFLALTFEPYLIRNLARFKSPRFAAVWSSLSVHSPTRSPKLFFQGPSGISVQVGWSQIVVKFTDTFDILKSEEHSEVQYWGSFLTSSEPALCNISETNPKKFVNRPTSYIGISTY